MARQKINEQISAPRVVLILQDGEKYGEVTKIFAIDTARKAGLDLVQVSDSYPPVCKIINYGKMLYEKSKQEKHKQHTPQSKEVRIKYKTDEHDINIKKKSIREFLSKGHKVRFVMLVKGREKFITGNAAREKFLTLVKEFSLNCRLNDIQEGDDAYSIVLHPVSSGDSDGEKRKQNTERGKPNSPKHDGNTRVPEGNQRINP